AQVGPGVVEAEAVRLAQRRKRHFDGEELRHQRCEVDLRRTEDQALFLVVIEFVQPHRQVGRTVQHRVDELGVNLYLDPRQAAAAIEHGHTGDAAVDDEVVVAARVEDPDVPLERPGKAQAVGLEQVFGRFEKTFLFYFYVAARRVVKQGGKV